MVDVLSDVERVSVISVMHPKDREKLTVVVLRLWMKACSQNVAVQNLSGLKWELLDLLGQDSSLNIIIKDFFGYNE